MRQVIVPCVLLANTVSIQPQMECTPTVTRVITVPLDLMYPLRLTLTSVASALLEVNVQPGREVLMRVDLGNSNPRKGNLNVLPALQDHTVLTPT